MAEVKVLCPNCNTPRIISVEKKDGTVYLYCKRCFKRSPILFKDGNVVVVEKPKVEKPAEEEKPKEKKVKEEKPREEKKPKDGKPSEFFKPKDQKPKEDKK
jgi:hypothetical protein